MPSEEVHFAIRTGWLWLLYWGPLVMTAPINLTHWPRRRRMTR